MIVRHLQIITTNISHLPSPSPQYGPLTLWLRAQFSSNQWILLTCYLYRKLSDINLHPCMHVHLYTVIITAPFSFHNFQSKSSAVHPSWWCMDVVSTQEDSQCGTTKTECWDGNRSSSHLVMCACCQQCKRSPFPAWAWHIFKFYFLDA